MTFDNAKIMQTERRASSLLECYAVVQLILCKDMKYETATEEILCDTRLSVRFYAILYVRDLTRDFEHESHELNEFFIAHGSHGSHGSYTRIFLNTNNPNNTNIFWHTDLTRILH